jgi:poly(hydroxyalkanoate) depolymerase family esterase
MQEREENTFMSDLLQDGMAEATRLTRQGRLAEATAAIQRVLGGTYAPVSSPDGPGSAEERIETARRAANEAPRPAAPSRPGEAEHALRRAPAPPRRFRGMSWTPGDDLLGAASGSTLDIPTPAVVPAGGRFVELSYTGRAGTRAYKLYIPSGYVGQEVPLIVMLHGCTQGPDDFALGTHMNALAEEHTFLVAYPAQASNANMSKCWNWFKPADQQRGCGEPSIIAGITREVVGEYRVAAGRVYVAGMSAGGAMAAIVGATYPDLYAAIGVHSGLAPGAAHDLPSAFAAMRGGGPGTARRHISTVAAAEESIPSVPVIVFHGDRDTTVHPRNADQLLAHYRDETNTARGRDAAGRLAPPVTVQQGQVPGGHAYTRATYHDADGRAVMEQWTVHGLGHAWSGGSSPGSYTDPKGPDASAEMVRFFDQHRKRGTID